MKNRKKTFEIALLGLLLALEFVFAYVKIPMASGLCITFNMVPVAIAAIAMGISGGAIVGGIFGLLSFSTCFGWFGGDAFGALLLNMNPFYTFVLCVVTRVMVGALAAAIHKLPTWPECVSKCIFLHLEIHSNPYEEKKKRWRKR